MGNVTLKIARADEIQKLRNLSTEKLIIWIIGRSKELDKRISSEDIVLECWLINSEKHSLRGFPQFPCSHTVLKRLADMKGKKALLVGAENSGYSLTEISRRIFADLKILADSGATSFYKPGSSAALRDISAIEEAPYKRLRKTPAYEKYKNGHPEQIVETDFLYFYGVNWHTKTSSIHNRIKNIDATVEKFAPRDETLKEVHKLLNTKFENVRKKLLNEKEIKNEE